jgi:hypothetical protein
MAVFGLLALAIAVCVVLARPDTPMPTRQGPPLAPVTTPTTTPRDDHPCLNNSDCPGYTPPRTATTPTTPDWSVYCYQHPENKPECGPATPTTSLPYSPNGCPANGHPWCSNPTATENPEGPSAPSCVPTETVSCGPGFGPGAPAWTTPTPRTWATPTDHQRGAVAFAWWVPLFHAGDAPRHSEMLLSTPLVLIQRTEVCLPRAAYGRLQRYQRVPDPGLRALADHPQARKYEYARRLG